MMQSRQRSSPAPPGEPLLTIVRAQIIFLLSTVNQDNFDKNASDIDELVQRHGVEANVHFVRRLIIAASPSLNTPTSKPPHHLILRFLTREVSRLTKDTSSVSVLVQAVYFGLKDVASVHDVFANFDYASIADSLPPLNLVVYAAALARPAHDAHHVFSQHLRPNVFVPLLDDALARLRSAPQPLFDSSSEFLSSLASLVYSAAGPDFLLRFLEPLRSDSSLLQQVSRQTIQSLPAQDLVSDRHPFDFLTPFAALGLLGPDSDNPASSSDSSSSDNFSSSLLDTALDRLSQLAPPDHLNRVLVDLLTRAGSSSAVSPSHPASSSTLPPGLDLHLFTRSVIRHNLAPDWSLLVSHWDHDDSVRLPPIDVLAAFIQSDTQGTLYDALFVDLPFPHDPASNSDPAAAGPLHARFRLLEALLQLGPDRLDGSAIPRTKSAVPEHVSDLPPDHPTQATVRTPHRLSTLWNIVATTHAALREPRRRLLDRGLATYPELVLPALVGSNRPQPLGTSYHDSAPEEARKLADNMVYLFIHDSTHPATHLALYRVRMLDHELLLNQLRKVYYEKETSLTRVLDVAVDLGILDDLIQLASTDTESRFVFDLVSAASKRDDFNLEAWLTDKVQRAKTAARSAATGADGEIVSSQVESDASAENQGENGESKDPPVNDKVLLDRLVGKALDFVGYKVRYDLERLDSSTSTPATTVSLSINMVATFMRILRANHHLFTPSDVEQFKEVRTQCLQLHPRLINFLPGVNADGDMHPARFNAEIEGEVDALYKKYYDLELKVGPLITLLSRVRNSEDSAHRDFFSCFMHSLFEEARFFPTYPQKELALTAALFGELIMHDLIEGIPLGIAVRYVLDALRNRSDSSWFTFGVEAIDHFQGRLREWPQLANSILNIPHLHVAAPQVDALARNVLMNPKKPDEPRMQPPEPTLEDLEALQRAGLGHLVGGDRNLFANFGYQPPMAFTAITVDTQELSKYPEPDEEIVQKILFHINNMSLSNLDDKVADMAEKLLESPEMDAENENDQEKDDETNGDGAEKAENVDEGSESKTDTTTTTTTTKKSTPKRSLDAAKSSWLAAYLVSERVSFEPNNHPLYFSLLEKLNFPALFTMVQLHTYGKSAQLLNSEKTITSSNERAHLKNLGSWLGLLTLAQNKPLLHRHVALKDLLIQGFDAQRLIVAIPFVCKILEHAARSKIFKPPNPWLMAIVKLLVELYHSAQLKLNLKFEIEVLFKALELDLDAIEPTNILQTRPQPVEDAPSQDDQSLAGQSLNAVAHHFQQQQQQQTQRTDHQLQQLQTQQQQQAALNQIAQSYLPPAGGLNQQHSQSQQQIFGGPAQPTQQQQQQLQDPITSASANLQAYVQVNSAAMSVFQGTSIQPAHLRRGIQIAIDRAIREVIGPVVERSVTIAVVSTQQLVTKDFTTESDEEKLSKAAHAMVQSLAGNLAKVTCKEPLRNAMIANIKQLFTTLLNDLQNQGNHVNPHIPDAVIAVTTSDNLDLACSVVDRVAMEKATAEVDETLTQAYLARRKHRERTPQQAFWDSNSITSPQYASALPDPLRLKFSGLQPLQLQVYDAFNRVSTMQTSSVSAEQNIPHFVQQQQQQQRQQQSPAMDSTRFSGLQQQQADQAPRQQYQNREGAIDNLVNNSDDVDMNDAAANSGNLIPPQQALEKFIGYLDDLERFLNSDALSGITSLPADHDLHVVLAQISLTAARSVSRDETTLACTQKVVQLLFRAETSLARDAYATLLKRLCRLSQKVASEVNAWFVYADDQRKRNVAVIVTLLFHQLINPVEFDTQSAKMLLHIDPSQPLSTSHASLQDFISRLLSVILPADSPYSIRYQFSRCIDALAQLSENGKATDSTKKFLEEFHFQSAESSQGNSQDTEQVRLREQLTFCFMEWLRIFQTSPRLEDSFVKFVVELQSQGVLKGEEISSLFFRVCTEVSFDSYVKQQKNPGNASNIYQPIDAFSKLITFMIKYHAPAVPGADNMAKAKVHYLTKILSIVVLVLAQAHEEMGKDFPQKPFFRFFSSLLANLQAIETQLGTAYNQILIAMSHSFVTLQPAYFPSFAFSWVSLISHRLFMPKLLQIKGREGWPWFHKLMYSILRFISPVLATGQLSDNAKVFYAGTLRILLILIHDFPSWVAFYAPSLLDVIPENCVQLINLICSAYPTEELRNLPDAFVTKFDVETIPELQSVLPTFDYIQSLSRFEQKIPVDISLATSKPAAFLQSFNGSVLDCIREPVEEAPAERQFKYDAALIRAAVGFAGSCAANENPGVFDKFSTPVEFLHTLIEGLDPEGRYLTLCAIANNLRYPDALTFFFASFLLHEFKACNSDAIKEQIVRVLLERICAAKPHPWGVITVFVNLISDESYDLYNYEFVRCAPEIEKLFAHVKTSIEQAGRQ